MVAPSYPLRTRPTLLHRVQACYDVLVQGAPEPEVARHYNVPVSTLKAWLRAARMRRKALEGAPPPKIWVP